MTFAVPRGRTLVCALATILAFGVLATGEAAACDDRPGTPNNVAVSATSSSGIKITWTNTTNRGGQEHCRPGGFGADQAQCSGWFDIRIRDANKQPIGLDRTGWGPQLNAYGSQGSTTVGGLQPGTEYCVNMRARTHPGTAGCISAIDSNWACATTLGAAPGPTAARCPSGQVWRERFDGDAVCVKPAERFRMEDGTCRVGYVWRDSFPGDGVCVTPAQRKAAKDAAKRKIPGPLPVPQQLPN